MMENEVHQRYREGLALDREGNRLGAIEKFNQVVGKATGLSDRKYRLSALHNLGCKLYELGRTDEALAHFAAAAREGHAGALYYLGCHHEKTRTSLSDQTCARFFRSAALAALTANHNPSEKWSKLALEALDDLGLTSNYLSQDEVGAIAQVLQSESDDTAPKGDGDCA